MGGRHQSARQPAVEGVGGPFLGLMQAIAGWRDAYSDIAGGLNKVTLCAHIVGMVAAMIPQCGTTRVLRVKKLPQHPWLTETVLRGGQGIWLFSLM